jgi:hypothetical protein
MTAAGAGEQVSLGEAQRIIGEEKARCLGRPWQPAMSTSASFSRT